jgi:multidrug resistance efflux pump
MNLTRPTDASKIFRKAALDRLSSPEQLHTLMRVSDGKSWLALVGCALIIATAVVWSVRGRIQTKFSASGILVGREGLVEIAAQGEGEVMTVDVVAGADVKEGQIVATIAQPTLIQRIETSKRRLDELDQDARSGALSVSQTSRRDRLKEELAQMQAQLEAGAHLASPVDGRVVEIRAVAGEHVSAGTPIAVIERAGRAARLDALLYFDAHVGKELRPGMTVELSPSTVKRERSGVLLGRVRSVEMYPATRLGMMAVLHNEQLVDSFIQAAGGAPLAVEADLEEDARTPSGYRWSSGAGPEVTLTSGTQITGAVITRTQRPIALVFPALD